MRIFLIILPFAIAVVTWTLGYMAGHSTGMQEGSANTMDFCLSILSVLDDSKGDEIDC